MPEFHYLDNNIGNDAARSFGNAASGLAYQLPQLRLAAERVRQQQALNDAHRILYGAQVQRDLSQAKLNDAKRIDQENKSQYGKEAHDAVVKSAEARRRIHEAQTNPVQLGPLSPSPMGIATALAPYAMQQQNMQKDIGDYMANTMIGAGGQYPDRAEKAIRGTMADVESGLATNPSLAQAIVTGTKLMHNVPAGAMSQNLATGVNTLNPQQPKIANQIPLSDYNARKRSDAITRYITAHPGADAGDIASMVRAIDQALGAGPATNAPPPGAVQQSLGGRPQVAPAPSGNIPHPTQRQVGDIIKTPKGTFKWAGDGWEPANP